MSDGDSLRVRRATSVDLPSLVEFTIAQVHEGEGKIKGREVIERGIQLGLSDEQMGYYWVLVNEQDVPVGFASATRTWSDWNAGYYWWVEGMYVSLDRRGIGGMRMLLETIHNEMLSQDGIELRIYVNKDNRAAKRAYERSGFRLSVYEVMVMVEDS